MTKKNFHRLTRAELEAELQRARDEASAWQLVHVFPKPEFELRVELGDGTLERWSLHGTHRISGPVLLVTPSGSWPTAKFLMHVNPLVLDPYRTSALGRCRAFAIEAADKLATIHRPAAPATVPFSMGAPVKDRREDAEATVAKSRCTCERACATPEEHICRLSRALDVHKTTCTWCRRGAP